MQIIAKILVGITLLFSGCTGDSITVGRGVSLQAGVEDALLRVDLDRGAARQFYIEGLQDQSGPAYQPQSDGGSIHAVHPAFGLREDFEADGIIISSMLAGWDFGYTLVSFGRAGMAHDIQPAVPYIEGDFVRYDRGVVREWYRNGRLGVEQGFLLLESVEGEGPVHLRGRISGGLHASREAGAGEMRFYDADGEFALALTDLFVLDADGAMVNAWINVDHDHLVISIDDRGARYPLYVDPLYGVSDEEVAATDATVFDAFGWDVDIDGDVAVVGAPFDDDGGRNSGAAYVYRRTAAGWVQEAKLDGSTTTSWDNFGNAVAISDDTIVVGAWADNDFGSRSGSAYVFERVGSEWVEVAKITAPDGDGMAYFGSVVDIYEDRIVIGAPGDDAPAIDSGAAYVYTRTGGRWSFAQKITATDGGRSHLFGTSVAISQTTILVGADGHGTDPVSAGAAYVFSQTDGTWRETETLQAPDGATGDRFGAAVDIQRGVAIVGAPGADAVGEDSGRAYVYRQGSGTWEFVSSVTKDEAAAGDQYGYSVATDGTNIAVGAPGHGTLLAERGTVEVLRQSSAGWARDIGLSARDAAAGDQLGYSVAISDYELVVGAPFGAVSEEDSGSLYHWGLRLTVGSACVRDGECGSGFCTDGVCCVSACGGEEAADCQACSVAAGAAVDGVCAPLALGTVCREEDGICDAAEACDGTSVLCPSDIVQPAGSECRAATGACDAVESCDGLSARCPADSIRAAGDVCRASAGACDSAEACDGTSVACPADELTEAGAVCRGAVGSCDVTESCDGLTAACPGDERREAGVSCRASVGVCDLAESCDGISEFCPVDGFEAPGVTCRSSLGVCDVAEVCSGSAAVCPSDVRAPVGMECRAASGICDIAEACDGIAAGCPEQEFIEAGVECRGASGACDVAEACTGESGACPSDAWVAAGAVCREAAGGCDVSEACTGLSGSCPAESFAAAGVSCRPAAGACDVAESCTGASSVCPEDSLSIAGVPCRPAAGACDTAEVCAGDSVACPADVVFPRGTMCREATGSCDQPEVCLGESSLCPADETTVDGTPCDDGTTCFESEVCSAGLCGLGTPLDCDDQDPCTADFCAEPVGCGHDRINGCSGETDPERPQEVPELEGNDGGVTEVNTDGSVEIVAPPEQGGCSVGHPSQSSGMGLWATTLIAMLWWRRRR